MALVWNDKLGTLRLLQVLHLLGMGLVEEQQHLSADDTDTSFNFTLKISSKDLCLMAHFCLIKDCFRWLN